MTGFARAQAENEAYEAEVEIRSVNSRYLDVRVRISPAAACLEMQVRDRVVMRLGRGKVDVNVHLKPKRESAYEIEVDARFINELVRTARTLGAELGIGGHLTVSDLIGYGRGFSIRERDLSGAKEAWDALSPALEQALENLDRMRAAEGAELRADLEHRMGVVAGLLDGVEARADSSREARRRDLLERVQELAVASLEPAVLAMEVARLVERSDVSEELTRFRSHLGLWKQVMDMEESCGKKLDFIVQEMNREVNTIGSKCQDAAIAERVIAIKSEVERVREQIQNIE